MRSGNFDLKSLANYLHLTGQQVSKLAEKGKIPGRRVDGDWRFPRAEIHQWLERRIGQTDEVEELAEMENALQRSARADEQQAISIAQMLPPEAICTSLPAKTRSSAISAMVTLAANTGLLWDPEKMVEAVRAREEMHPTALENGVALLHPRQPMASILGQAFLALGRTSAGVPFGGSDGTLTDVFFLICSTSDGGHLRTLARLSRMIGADGFLGALREAPDAASAHALIAETESRL